MKRFLCYSCGATRPAISSWDEPHKPIVITSELHLPESPASAGTNSWLPVTRHEELAADRPGRVRTLSHYRCFSHEFIACITESELLSSPTACSVSQDRVQGRRLASRGCTTTWASPSPWLEAQAASALYLQWDRRLGWATVTSTTSAQCAATSRLVRPTRWWVERCWRRGYGQFK